jgi:hypothetical protein
VDSGDSEVPPSFLQAVVNFSTVIPGSNLSYRTCSDVNIC